MPDDPHISGVAVNVYTVPTDAPESDGTLKWDATTMVLVQAQAGGEWGLGFTYGHRASALIINDLFRPLLVGRSAFDIAGHWQAMRRAARNIGLGGVVAHAISAVDVALWDLKARLLGVGLADLLGAAREAVPAYGSGGFTSYSIADLRAQLGGWAADGLPWVKMKVGRQPLADPERVAQARDAIGPDTGLMVDANGAYDRKQALWAAERFAEAGVSWFEEPVPSGDVAGLRLLRDRLPGGMEVAAGEYGYDVPTFRGLLRGGAVDVLQADATRCGGLTGFLAVAALADAFNLPLSAHTAPSIHLPVCLACANVRHIEYFHDHTRLEHLLFDGAARPEKGLLRPDPARPGLGLTLKAADAERYAA
jgi:L-alanine-DL-glutamate epimerase-like enolase superfamily enzyme